MSENKMSENKIEYLFTISIKSDCITIVLTGESIDFNKHNPEAIIRPRHIRLSNELTGLMRTYMRETK